MAGLFHRRGAAPPAEVARLFEGCASESEQISRIWQRRLDSDGSEAGAACCQRRKRQTFLECRREGACRQWLRQPLQTPSCRYRDDGALGPTLVALAATSPP